VVGRFRHWRKPSHLTPNIQSGWKNGSGTRPRVIGRNLGTSTTQHSSEYLPHAPKQTLNLALPFVRRKLLMAAVSQAHAIRARAFK
jgi:hypothetical protein